MNILFATNSLGFGGAEKMLTFIAGSLSDRGHSVGIVNFNNVPNYINVHRQSIREGINVYEYDHEKKNGTITYIKFLYAAAKAQKADVIVSFTSFPSMCGKIAGVMLNIPSVMSERGDPSKTSTKSLKSRLMRLIINSSKGGVFQTEGAKSYYGKGLQRRSVVIPNPIFVKGEIASYSIGEREKSIVSVGRLDNVQKRYDIMLEAFRIFHENHPNYNLKLYGTGNDEDKIRQWVIDKKLTDSVLFMGVSKNPIQDIAKDGMFLITSDYEGISNSLLEAMAAGLPCVSTDHTPGGARLLIEDHENGLLAPIGDSGSIANAMCEFAENPDLAAKCGENAKCVLQKYEPQKIIDMWEQYIHEVCS